MIRPRTLQHAGFLLLLVVVTIAFAALVYNFIQPIFWAAVLAIVFRPVERQVLAATGGRTNLAPVLTTIAVVLLVFVPLGIIGVAVSREAVNLYNYMGKGDIVNDTIARFQPMAVNLASRFGVAPDSVTNAFTDAAGTVAQFMGALVLVFGQSALKVFGQVGLMLYLLFFFLRDGESILISISRATPLGDAQERVLFERFTAVTRATLKGTLAVGAVQGTVGGLLFWILGIDAPAFWGVMMTVMSLVPLVGSAVVWLPAALILIATGSVTKGVILLAGGGLGISIIDNILRPLLVGRETRIPDYLVLISTLGGIALFGLSGFIAGPAICALFLTTWDMFGREYAQGGRSSRADSTSSR